MQSSTAKSVIENQIKECLCTCHHVFMTRNQIKECLCTCHHVFMTNSGHVTEITDKGNWRCFVCLRNAALVVCVRACVRAWVTWVIVGRWIWKYIYHIPGPKVINRTICDNGACSHNVNSFCLSKPYITLPNIALNVRGQGRININTPNTCNVSPQSTIKALSFI